MKSRHQIHNVLTPLILRHQIYNVVLTLPQRWMVNSASIIYHGCCNGKVDITLQSQRQIRSPLNFGIKMLHQRCVKCERKMWTIHGDIVAFP